MGTVYLIGICLILLATLVLIIGFAKDKILFEVLAACIFCIGLSCITISIIFCSKPTAIDVYRGKTTLEITYRDSIPVDSAVVFKKK